MMNTKQRTTVLTACVIGIVMAAVPPWRFSFDFDPPAISRRDVGVHASRFAGYAPLVLPPKIAALRVCEAFELATDCQRARKIIDEASAALNKTARSSDEYLKIEIKRDEELKRLAAVLPSDRWEQIQSYCSVSIDVRTLSLEALLLALLTGAVAVAFGWRKSR
jgi:hypothetical protein